MSSGRGECRCRASKAKMQDHIRDVSEHATQGPQHSIVKELLLMLNNAQIESFVIALICILPSNT